MLRNIETGKHRYFYAHEINTLFDNSMLLCTKADLTTIQIKVNQQDIFEVCTQGRQNTKLQIKLNIFVNIFAALGKSVPMGCPDSVILESLLRNHQVNFLILYQNTKKPHKMTINVFFERLQFICMD